jgi:hypothetical protein
MRRVLRVLVFGMLVTAAAMTPRQAQAEVVGAACGFGSPFWNCGDEATLRYMCDYLCPEWTFAVCQDEMLTCYSEPW